MILFVSKMFMVVHKKIFFYILFVFAGVINAKTSFAHDEFINVIAQAKPAVVKIEVTRSKKQSKPRYSSEAAAKQAVYYEEDLKGLPRRGNGSGFIIKYSEGQQNPSVLILTAAHVVLRTSKIKVLFSNGKSKAADIVWIDKRSDVALLKVETVHAPHVELSLMPEKVLEGQSILSIAASFNLSVSSSLGIVSGVNVVNPRKKGRIKYIQTDAAINPGSSGGPLLDKNGKVVGMISDIYSTTGSFSGTAFAIPALDLLNVIDKKGLK